MPVNCIFSRCWTWYLPSSTYNLPHWLPWLVIIPLIDSWVLLSSTLLAPAYRWLWHCQDSTSELAISDDGASCTIRDTVGPLWEPFIKKTPPFCKSESAWKDDEWMFDSFWWASLWPSWLYPKCRPVPHVTKLSLCLASAWSSLASLWYMTKHTSPWHLTHTFSLFPQPCQDLQADSLVSVLTPAPCSHQYKKQTTQIPSSLTLWKSNPNNRGMQRRRILICPTLAL